jgi:surfactin synthase thioesterase subunit
MTPFIRPRRLADPELRLVVIPHAGGSAAAYYPIATSLPRRWEPLLLDLPGRGRRGRSAPLTDVVSMAATAAADIRPWADGTPLALFGHSLGAVVAVETARLLQNADVALTWTGVSGSASPQARAVSPSPDRELTDAELLAEMAEMGGLHKRVGEAPELLRRFLDLVRSDLRALNRYRPDPARPALASPLTAFGAAADKWAPPEAVGSWSSETSSVFRHRTFAGGHFYLFDMAEAFAREIAREVGRCLSASAPLSATLPDYLTR